MTTLTFFDIEVDSVSRERCLPLTKLARLKSVVAEWCSKKSASKHDLLVIIGLPCDTAQLVPAERPFIRSLIDAMSHLKAANHIPGWTKVARPPLPGGIHTLRLGTGTGV